MFNARNRRKMVVKWVDAQAECPTRKQAKTAMPDAPLKVIRSAIQSRKDREQSR
jgi:hypothetical protein